MTLATAGVFVFFGFVVDHTTVAPIGSIKRGDAGAFATPTLDLRRAALDAHGSEASRFLVAWGLPL